MKREATVGNAALMHLPTPKVEHDGEPKYEVTVSFALAVGTAMTGCARGLT